MSAEEASPRQSGEEPAAAGLPASVRARIAARASAALDEALAQPLAPGLYVVATPIGHLADMTLRAIAVLAGVRTIWCEDTRHSRRLLDHYGIGTPLASYHEHNAHRERPRVLAALEADQAVALVSDAGTPLISDPGLKLVQAVIDAGQRVTVVPGPSAVTTALAASGLASDRFLFAGFLPPRQGQRRARIAELAAIPATLIVFEAPSRLAEALADLAEGLGDRRAVVARELTKLYEEVRRGSLAELAAWALEDTPRGEMVVLVAPPGEATVDDAAVRAAVAALAPTLGLKAAAREVAERLGVSQRRAYQIGLALRGGEGEP
ncbi:MAG: 16S rRNA (cytidine(1402)-2'-O)-methyltransferase [Hyphomicrobiaceae bacterium]